MPILKPKAAWQDFWGCFLAYKSQEIQRCEIIIYEEDSVEIVFQHILPNRNQCDYYMYGYHEKHSDGYGWFVINRIQKVMPMLLLDIQVLNIGDFVYDIFLEYFRVDITVQPHPGNVWKWDSDFDMLLLLQNSTLEIIETIQQKNSGTSKEDLTAEPRTSKDVVDVLTMLDRKKFLHIA